MDLYVLQVPLIGPRLGSDGRPFTSPASSGDTLLRGSMACWHAAAWIARLTASAPARWPTVP